MSQADWDAVSAAALALFEFGQAQAAQRGLLLVDTKYEFGKDAAGNICLIDEVRGCGGRALLPSGLPGGRALLALLAGRGAAQGQAPGRGRCCPAAGSPGPARRPACSPPVSRPPDPHAGQQPLLAGGHVRGAPRGGAGAAEHRQGVPAAVVQGALRPLQGRGGRGARDGLRLRLLLGAAAGARGLRGVLPGLRGGLLGCEGCWAAGIVGVAARGPAPRCFHCRPHPTAPPALPHRLRAGAARGAGGAGV
jgi:hypothetical protein